MSDYGSTSHKGPQRGLLLSALIKSTPPPPFFSLFFFLVLNWKLSFSAANNCNKIAEYSKLLACSLIWHLHLWVLLSLCWLSTSHSLCIVNADAPERWLRAWVRALWAQSLGIWQREETVEGNGGVTTQTSQDAFEKSLALPILVRYLCSAMWTEKLSRGLLRAWAKVSTEIFLSC